ncbi:heme A synthase [Shouchella clausii]|uniref:Heme A synthase n=3 Tax=Shouchella TaxID=2893057 RepID=CTAA_SHOC1|nr:MULTISPECIES: heme A synthase [Shouchella]Q5WFD1.1 RecName: Full=Heme A synthase; Short=HAS; AltName: Full=Cytochrome aa3-controlling protein [Shouchella clausii KSM-K16]MCM3312322.1 heme A synthase [Psychrobacillus sp. MER TA 17]KKI84611.1 heme A synthase [Shouchella clausii]MBU3230692.1 heme A synthase [Shouchella clausii]MBU3263233.1 heme A synthase [Shouchella clausii]MBU3505698.1 heme A synthase [Shouchella clausii]
MHKGLKRLGVITSLGVLLVLIQGALVTNTGSGEGCGQTWPLCFGQVIPLDPPPETVIEFSHRLVAGIVGMLVILMAIWSWRRLKHMPETRFLAVISVFMIIFQGLLGAGAVVFGQSDLIMALHFGFSALSFASVVLLTRLAFEDSNPQKQYAPIVSKAYKGYVIFVAIYSYVAIYTGAYVKHTNATLACSGFPLCNGQWVPDVFTEAIGVQLLHRSAAILLSLLLLVLFIWTVKTFRASRVLVVCASLAMLLVIGQAASGVAVVLTYNATLTLGIFHALLISLLFTLLCYMVMLVTRHKAK